MPEKSAVANTPPRIKTQLYKHLKFTTKAEIYYLCPNNLLNNGHNRQSRQVFQRDIFKQRKCRRLSAWHFARKYFRKYFDGIDEELLFYQPVFEYLLMDISQKSDREIAQMYEIFDVRVALLTMKKIFEDIKFF